MRTSGSKTSDPVSWARRVNNRWIVHRGLGEAAELYLNHLESIDPKRLAQSCLNAQRLIGESSPAEDPKPWFYAGLFSLATADEARRVLKDHPFTASTVPALAGESTVAAELADASEETRSKIARIREAARRLSHP